MITAKLVRTAAHPDHGSFGAFRLDTEPFCVTLEPYARDNKPNVSCINTGIYLCRRTWSGIVNGWTFEITDVADRTLVRFHPGNLDDHTGACIILAQYFGKLEKDWAILNSGKTFRKFMKTLEGVNEFMLTIVEEY